MKHYPNRRSLLSLSLLAALAASGCTAPSETTGIGAATGGAIGAGLGAIIGSQTGDPGAGLVLGALAGSAGGGLVGNALQAQEEAIKTQDEAIERQERTISAQRRELNELRQMKGDAGPPMREDSARDSAFESADLGGVDDSVQPLGRMKERSLTGTLGDDAPASTSGNRRATFPVEETGRTVRAPTDSSDSEECRKAGTEMQSATKTSEASEQLFHIRRALRLCPDKPAFHAELAKVYKKLGRSSDAEFELNEVKRLGGAVAAPAAGKVRDRY